MVAVDTNVVVRFLTADHPAQFKKASHIFEQLHVFIPHTVILETEWVLRHTYGFDSEAICDAYNQLFGLPNVEVENPHSMVNALEWYQEGLDFADALHLALSQGCEAFYSFDARFVKGASPVFGIG